jgi:hypothetical protein
MSASSSNKAYLFIRDCLTTPATALLGHFYPTQCGICLRCGRGAVGQFLRGLVTVAEERSNGVSSAPLSSTRETISSYQDWKTSQRSLRRRLLISDAIANLAFAINRETGQ